MKNLKFEYLGQTFKFSVYGENGKFRGKYSYSVPVGENDIDHFIETDICDTPEEAESTIKMMIQNAIDN